MIGQVKELEGVLLVDKPTDHTSHDVVARLRRKLNMRKIGHAGTLDPMATGLLIMLIGKATRISQYLISLDKEYEGTIQLGQTTDSQDADGEVVETRPVPPLTEAEVRATMQSFLGDQYQMPPMYSAIKVGGVPLYKLARQGVEVERELREVEIYSLSFDWIKLPEAAFTVRCSRGTYVRTLASDLGEALGCGAHLLELRRTQSGLFLEDEAISIETLRECADPASLLFPLDRALSHLKGFELGEEGGRRLGNGIAPLAADLPEAA